MFPLLNFATYSENYSYKELFYIQDNPFTLLLDTPDYYKWWNIKALINFKWNTYGKIYYFIIWAIYSIFMCCFLIVSTIPKHKISWIDQLILLIATIFLGLIHFIFEVRQLIHKPKEYIKSPWNWFDLAAILVPTITSLVWLHDMTPPTWIITISAFLLEIKFLLYFRIMVLAFAHSLHLLLRPTSEYSYDQPSYTDDVNNPWNLVSTYKFISSNGTIDKSSLIETPDENTNLFSLFSTSILAVYFMLTVSVNKLKKYVKCVEDKNNLPSEILEIAKIEDNEKTLQNKIDEALAKMNETLKNQVNEILKDPLDKINKLIELTEKKESE
ncbi:1876_t:CDS:2 [Dentiscutata heterogama]|uniref:1876_t:CDS:1 n=1 Tax=Dentiscutata heterogama TaxID=1316150 RepID=A0ACA9JW68_9GLOM|nr:1876_t:CDS:2 [Dentiscutata heterogama]